MNAILKFIFYYAAVALLIVGAQLHASLTAGAVGPAIAWAIAAAFLLRFLHVARQELERDHAETCVQAYRAGRDGRFL